MGKILLEEAPGQPGAYLAHCPGCNMLHIITTAADAPQRWTFNGDMESPTFSPSLLVTYEKGPHYQDTICHSFIRDGHWEFLGDCTHKLAGQRVPMVNVDSLDD